MAEAFHEFDESFDDDEPSRLLPPEDRVWRHPSEISWQSSAPIAAEVSAARERWLSRTPTRAGAWSAGLVGAVLATGVVLVGTHLTVWLGRSPSPSSRLAIATTTLLQPEVTPGFSYLERRVQAGLTVVEVSKQGGTVNGNGVVLTADGKILVPLPLIRGASAITVTAADGAVYAARLVGTDSATQLAVISTGSGVFRPLASATDTPLHSGDWLAVEWAELSRDSLEASVFSMASVSSSVAVATDGTYQLLDMLRLQMPRLSGAPLGTVLVNGQADVLGIVTACTGNEVLVIPGLLAEQVGEQIISHGRVIHGWLGIEGRSSVGSVHLTRHATSEVTGPRGQAGLPAGVEVVAVGRGTSAASAGLRPGDVIEAVNGLAIDSMQALQEALYVMPPRTDVALTVERGKSIRTIDALLQPAA
ncbi:MAG: PDZ domain-containing protein [Acidimicrobiales bacterium]